MVHSVHTTQLLLPKAGFLSSATYATERMQRT